MLQMIPMVSKEKSNALVNNPKYSCPKRLFEAMNDNSVTAVDKLSDLQRSFGKLKNGTVRMEASLAKKVYKLMTVTDPDKNITDDS
jgi:hypothetical protein